MYLHAGKSPEESDRKGVSVKALVDTCTINVRDNLKWMVPKEFNSDEVSHRFSVNHRFSVKITIPPNSENRVGLTESMTLRYKGYKENCTREINDANLSGGHIIPDLMGTIL